MATTVQAHKKGLVREGGSTTINFISYVLTLPSSEVRINLAPKQKNGSDKPYLIPSIWQFAENYQPLTSPGREKKKKDKRKTNHSNSE